MHYQVYEIETAAAQVGSLYLVSEVLLFFFSSPFLFQVPSIQCLTYYIVACNTKNKKIGVHTVA